MSAELDDSLLRQLTERQQTLAKEKGARFWSWQRKRDPENALGLRDRHAHLGYCRRPAALRPTCASPRSDHTFLARMGDHHAGWSPVACDSELLACNLPSVGVDKSQRHALALIT